MNIHDLNPASIELRKGGILQVPHGLGQRIEALSGTLWITIDNDRRDILVKSGEGFTIDRPGKALINALEDTRMLLLAATPAAHRAAWA